MRTALENAKDISTSDSALAFNLVPLDAEQLTEVAEVWRLRVQRTLADIAAIAAKLETAEGEDREALLSELEAASKYNIRNFDHYMQVLYSLNRKGGSKDDLDRHWSFAFGFILDLVISFDFATIFTLAKEWIFSSWGGRKALLEAVNLVFVLVGTIYLSRLLQRVTVHWLERRKVADQLALQLLPQTIYSLSLGAGLIVSLLVLGVDLGFTLAILGGLGFLLAFIFQNLLPSLSSGIMLQAIRPYERGDTVSINNVVGTVSGFNAVSTTLRSFDNSYVVIPNNQVWQSSILNYSKYPVRRVDMVFGIGYDDDIETTKETLMEMVSGHEKCLPKPAPRVFVGDLGESSVNVYCRPWVRSEDYWDVFWELTETGKNRLEQVGVSIAYPQQDINIRTSGETDQVRNRLLE